VNALEIWAAIDLHQGRVVSLRKGNPDLSTVWSDDPLAIAKRFEREGAAGLHVIDLDGALKTGSNRSIAESIVQKAKIPTQIGGGVRSRVDVDRWMKLGVDRVVLGTLAYNDTSTLHQIISEYGRERIVVATDYKNGKIVTKGWTKQEDLSVLEAIRRLQDSQIRTVLATAVEFDGRAQGPDLVTLRDIRASTNVQILASGGVRTIGDVQELKRVGVEGVVIGRALYEGTLDLPELSLGVR
jgi:phosphoribosylformimino-5-aminoimidazole carboxamide ribotide isomerase